MEAEFTASSQCIKEVLWIKNLLEELGLKINKPITINMDNQAAIRQLEGEESSARAKHIDIKLKFNKYYVSNGIIKLEYVPTSDQKADIFTKALPKISFEKFRSELNLQD